MANKAEGKAGESGILEAMALGLGDPIPFSAEHGEGVVDLFEALLPHRARRGRGAGGGGSRIPRCAAQAGDRRPSERGQVDADQQAAREDR
jgi:hypothetical protein